MDNNKNKITVKIKPAKIKGYNFEYIFIGKRKYIEYKIERYIRVLNYLQDRGLLKI